MFSCHFGFVQSISQRPTKFKVKQNKDGCHDKLLLIKLTPKTGFILACKFQPLLLKFSFIVNVGETSSHETVNHILEVVNRTVSMCLNL